MGAIGVLRLTQFCCLYALLITISHGAVISGFTGGILGQAGTDGTFGFAFDVGSNSEVISELGIWDYTDDGLAEPHDVGIWNSAGNLLATITIPAGTSATLLNGFRYEPISPITLSPTATYVLGAYYANLSLDFLKLQTTASTDPNFTLGEAQFAPGGALAFPGGIQPPGDDGFFGPNAALAAVPEGSAGWVTLPLVSLMALANRRWKRALHLGVRCHFGLDRTESRTPCKRRSDRFA